MVTILDENEKDRRYTKLRSSDYLQALIGQQPARKSPSLIPARSQRHHSQLFNIKNVDLLVLRPENQTRTTVTPLIFKYAQGLFPPEQLHLLDNRLPQLTPQDERNRRKQLLDFLHKANSVKGGPSFPDGGRIHNHYWKRIVRDRVEYKV